jgi:CubicO group peptidase (beta-lactamase class C family)
MLDLRRDYSEDELVEFARGLPLDFAPGSKWSYSNTGYVLLGIIIRRAGGKFYGDELRERVFAPLGMKTARVISEADIVANRAGGYRLDDAGELKNQEWVSPTLNTTADGALYVTILDMVAWDAGLRATSVLSREQLAEAWTPVRLKGGATESYGFGWFISEQRGSPLIEHSGSWQGFETHIARYTERGITVIVLANLADANPQRIATEVAGIVDNELRLPDPREPVKDPDSGRTRRVLDALVAWTEARPSEDMTESFAQLRDDSPRANYFRAIFRERVSGREAFNYLGEVDVASRGIERNGARIARIAYFGVIRPKGADRVAAYLDGSGRIADFTYGGY